MIHTIRTPLAAGAVAAVAAAGLLTAPADNAARLLAAVSVPSSAQFALTAWQNPIIALLDSGEMAENYVFGGYYNGGDAPTPGAGEANWPSAGFDQAGGDVLNYLLAQKPELGNYFDVGFLPNFAAEAYLPAVQQWQINVEDYISVVLSGLNLGARELATGVWDLPSAVINAVQLAVQGQFSEALTVIGDAIIAPIVAAGESVIAAATYVLSNVVARAGAVIAALPQILTTFAGWAVGSASILAEETAAIVTGVVSSLSTLNVEGAWNTAVDGLLGPSGIPGTLLNLITGAGVQTGPIVNPETDIPDNFVPSFRTSLQSAQWTVRGALEVEPAAAAPAPAAATVSEAPASASESPAPVEAADTAGTASGSPDASASQPRAAKREGERRAAASDRADSADRADRAERADRADRADRSARKRS